MLSTGVNVPNALFPINNADEGQLALAITGGYRGRFAWGRGIGSGSAREGLYVAANYNYLRGFQYENDAMAITLRTAANGLLIDASNILLDHHHASDGRGFSIDAGVGAVINRWEVGFGANGLGNRIDWSGLRQTRLHAPEPDVGQQRLRQHVDGCGRGHAQSNSRSTTARTSPTTRTLVGGGGSRTRISAARRFTRASSAGSAG